MSWETAKACYALDVTEEKKRRSNTDTLTAQSQAII